jgi:uncharacterized membrane protein YtjA (UPF0391 family)
MAAQWFGDLLLPLVTRLHNRVRGRTASSVPTKRYGVEKEAYVLYYALVFLIVAIIAGLLGFGAIAFAAAGIAKILFFVFLILFLISLVRHMSTRA